MRRGRTETTCCGYVNERVDRTKQDLEKRAAELEIRRSDGELIREATEKMDFGGLTDAIRVMVNALASPEQAVIDTAEHQSSASTSTTSRFPTQKSPSRFCDAW